MTPADRKDWWLAAAAISTMVGPAARADAATNTPAATTGAPVGIVAASSGNVSDGGSGKLLYVGNDTFLGEKLRTGADGTLHVMFMDQSAVTLAPNSELTIDRYSFDAAANTGTIGLTLTRGALRFVGGKITKTSEAVIKTPDAEVGIRGGITVVDREGGKTRGTFLFGQSMRMTSADSSQSQTVTRQGFGATFENGQLGDPQRTSAGDLSAMLGQFESGPGAQQNSSGQPGGAPPGQLLATGDRPGGGQNPGGTLSPDRLASTADRQDEANPPGTVRRGQETDASTDTVRTILDTKVPVQS